MINVPGENIRNVVEGRLPGQLADVFQQTDAMRGIRRDENYRQTIAPPKKPE